MRYVRALSPSERSRRKESPDSFESGLFIFLLTPPDIDSSVHETHSSILGQESIPTNLATERRPRPRAAVTKTLALPNIQSSLNEVFDALKSSWMRADPPLLFNEPIGPFPVVSPKISDHQRGRS